jgi:RNase P subunit RPR2
MTGMYQRLATMFKGKKCKECGVKLLPANVREFEVHHTAGQHQGKTVLLCKSCHQRITEKQTQAYWIRRKAGRSL